MVSLGFSGIFGGFEHVVTTVASVFVNQVKQKSTLCFAWLMVSPWFAWLVDGKALLCLVGRQLSG